MKKVFAFLAGTMLLAACGGHGSQATEAAAAADSVAVDSVEVVDSVVVAVDSLAQ